MEVQQQRLASQGPPPGGHQHRHTALDTVRVDTSHGGLWLTCWHTMVPYRGRESEVVEAEVLPVQHADHLRGGLQPQLRHQHLANSSSVLDILDQ